MNEEQQLILLRIVKKTLISVVQGGTIPECDFKAPELCAKCGCFVTLKHGERLRGCIGNFESDIPLTQLVGRMAKASATEDPRFYADPVTADELDSLEMEISVLSPLERTTEPLSLRLGVDGIYIRSGGYSGCFLPQVALETGWSKEEFLGNCCALKAGISQDAWKRTDTEVYLFQAEIFGIRFSDISLDEQC
jgi:AmmeMemoRadiSam system protein A